MAQIVTIKKWGNNAAVRIPIQVFKAAKLTLDQKVSVRSEGGRIVVEPVTGADYELSGLLAKITPENSPAAVDFGKQLGKEAW